MIVAGKMEQTVQDEYLNFDGKGMAASSALASRGGHADGQIARDFFFTGNRSVGGEGENVGCLVDAAKLPVQAANSFVCREQYGHTTSKSDCRLGLGKKLREGTS